MPPATQDAPRSSVRCTRTRHPAWAARRAMDKPMTPPPITDKDPAAPPAEFAGFAGLVISSSLRRHDPDQV
ncbi:hypothetical protein MBOU_02670 [Mycobacterium bourgelatii]|uniref:Uncharacterized protein n=1 Tax=Mycobacterium bourgelatii TaxID=1273442 RepID=A0A7I9YHR6_MYCBU|nr:hypothetical protein MBOU_02670 [Mycobacterium bourgelatii]